MRIFLFFIFCFVQFILNAQDTICKRNGEIISAKVFEINTKEIYYKRTDLLDGPLYIINKNEVKKIKYLTGTVDSFIVVNEIAKRQIVITHPVIIDNKQIHSTIRKGVYMYQGQRISDRKVLFLAKEKNQYWKNKEIELNISSLQRNKILQYTIGNGGLGIGVVGLYGSLIAISSNQSPNDTFIIAIIGVASAGIVVSSQIVSFSYKLKRIKNSDKIVELYNQYSKN